MIAFLRSTAGKWAVRLVGLLLTGAILALGAGLDWLGSGDAFLLALLALMLACGAYAFEQFVVLGLDVLAWRNSSPQQREQRNGPNLQPPRRVQWQGSIPPLSKAKQAQVRRLHAAMAEAGVFIPTIPEADKAFAAFAVDKQPVDWVGVLQSLAEAPFYHPELDEKTWEASWSANLLFDHIPLAWLDPPAGQVAAFLWEDENVFIALVSADSLATLGESIGQGEGWQALTEDLLPTFAEAGIPTR